MYQHIAKLLAEQGRTQKALAEAIGVSTGNVSDWKHGRAKPTTEVVVKIANYFGVSVDYLLGLSEIRNTATLTDIYKLRIDAMINDKAFSMEESAALRDYYLEMLLRFRQLLESMSNAIYRKPRMETLHDDAVNIGQEMQTALHSSAVWTASLPFYFAKVQHKDEAKNGIFIDTLKQLERITCLTDDNGLNEDEQDLIDIFRSLDRSGKRIVLATMESEKRRITE